MNVTADMTCIECSRQGCDYIGYYLSRHVSRMQLLGYGFGIIFYNMCAIWIMKHASHMGGCFFFSSQADDGPCSLMPGAFQHGQKCPNGTVARHVPQDGMDSHELHVHPMVKVLARGHFSPCFQCMEHEAPQSHASWLPIWQPGHWHVAGRPTMEHGGGGRSPHGRG